MPIVLNKPLYQKIKARADKIYDKPSAFKSGYIVKEYKKEGGRYGDDARPRDLHRWFKEKWVDVGHKQYPVFRPTVRVSKETPLTASEIDKEDLEKQIRKKQIIKGNENLKPFKPKS
jgi:hypothetical protein